MNAEEVRKIRESLGLSQQQFSTLVGASVKTISNWENGGKIPAARIAQLEAFRDTSIRGSRESYFIGNDSPGAGKGNDVNSDKVLLRAMDEISAQRRMAEKAQAQVDELLEILKSKL